MPQEYRIALPPRTQNGAADYMGKGMWRLWLHTPNFIHGTFLMLYPDGKVVRVVVREDEGDEEMIIKEAS